MRRRSLIFLSLFLSLVYSLSSSKPLKRTYRARQPASKQAKLVIQSQCLPCSLRPRSVFLAMPFCLPACLSGWLIYYHKQRGLLAKNYSQIDRKIRDSASLDCLILLTWFSFSRTAPHASILESVNQEPCVVNSEDMNSFKSSMDVVESVGRGKLKERWTRPNHLSINKHENWSDLIYRKQKKKLND